jgi:hypothetical protein
MTKGHMKPILSCTLTFAIAGCGFADPRDELAPDGSEPQPDVPLTRCDPAKPFGTPTSLAGINSSSNEMGAHLTADELTLYFSSDRPGSNSVDIYRASRSSSTDDFGTPERVVELSSSNTEHMPIVSPDGSVVYFLRGSNVFVAAANTAGVFGVPSPVPAADHPQALCCGVLTASGLYQGGNDIVFSPRAATGELGPAQPVMPLNSPQPDAYPALDGAERTILFSSNRESSGEIWMATRSSIEAPFDQPTKVDELSGLGGPTWLSLDGCELYLESPRAGGLGASDIYIARRPL